MPRLNFSLPPFCRYTWANDAAKQEWEQRFFAIRQALRVLEIRSVAENLRQCGAISIREWEMDHIEKQSAKFNLEMCLLSMPQETEPQQAERATLPIQKPMVWVGVGTARDELEQFAEAWRLGQQDTVGTMLGYPPCCIDFYLKYCIHRGWQDLTVPMIGSQITGSPFCGSKKPTDKSSSGSGEPTTICIDAPSPRNNILARRLGIKPFFHLPCSPDCQASQQIASELWQLGREIRFAQEMADLENILSWPMAWSSLHGIAEIRMPVLKATADTDALAQKIEIEWSGTIVPTESGLGVQFPYLPQPQRYLSKVPA